MVKDLGNPLEFEFEHYYLFVTLIYIIYYSI